MILAGRYGKTCWISPFISVGQTALTLYVAHIIFGTLFLKAVETREMELFIFPLWGTIVFYTSGLVFSYYWTKRFRRGPLELLMRRFLVLRGPAEIPPQEKNVSILVG